MTRIERNKGSYAQRSNGAWQIKFPLGWNEESKRYTSYNEDFLTESEAIAALKEINDFVYHGGSIEEIPVHRGRVVTGNKGNKISFSDFATEFCRKRKLENVVADRTLDSDQECINRSLPYIGAKPINKIKSSDIENMYASLRNKTNTHKKGRGYSESTLRRTHAVLNNIFNKAFKEGLVTENPLISVTKPKSDTKPRHTLSVAEAQNVYSVIVSEKLNSYSVGLLVALLCGVRLSEMLALTWNDYQDGALSITKTLKHERREIKDSTKNKTSRTVPCPLALCKVLDTWKEEQRDWMDSVGLKQNSATPISTDNRGRFILQDQFDKWFANNRKHYSISDDITPHCLRHTYASILTVDIHIDEETARTMSGHKSSDAFKIYTHSDDEHRRNAANRLGAVVAPEPIRSSCQYCALWSVSPNDPREGCCWGDSAHGIKVTGAETECLTGRFKPYEIA